MDLDFSDDQKALSRELSRYLAAQSPRKGLRAVLEAGGGQDPGLWRGLGELGWLAVSIPEEHGGLGLGPGMLCCVASELGKAMAAVPFASSIFLAAEAVMLYGSEKQKTKWLPELASGRVIGGFAVAEEPGELSATSISASVSSGALTGTKVAVSDGALCDVLIVVAKVDEIPQLHIVETKDDAVEVVSHSGVDPSHAPATVHFRSARAEPLAGNVDGWRGIRRLMDRAAVYLAFEQVGMADAALSMSLEYVKERRAFGRLIGSFQALKHKMADVWIANELARANAYYAAWALEAESDEALRLAAATVRVSANEASTRAARELIQVHGGIAVTWEHDAHLFYRRSQHLSLMLGSSRDWQRQVIAGLAPRVSGVQ